LKQNIITAHISLLPSTTGTAFELNRRRWSSYRFCLHRYRTVP